MSTMPRKWIPIASMAALSFATFPSTALAAKEGVAHGGGTDAAIARRLTIHELRSLAKDIKAHLLPVLNYQEQLAKGRVYPEPMRSSRLQNQVRISGKLLRSVQAKLFPETGRDAFHELANLDFKLRENGPCVDLQFHDKDATAFNADPREICLSAKRLLRKLTTANVMTELLAVAGHELAHRMGADEPEALEFQKVIRHTQLAGSLGEYTWRLSRIMTDNSPIFTNTAIRDLSAEGIHERPFAFCTVASRLYMEADAFLMAQYSCLGFSAVRARKLSALSEAGPLLGELALHCERVSRNEVPLGDVTSSVSRIQKLLTIVRAP